MSDQQGAVDPNGKQVVARIAAVLQALEGQALGLSLGDIAKATGLPKSTVQRLVGSLEAQSFVVAGKSGVRLGAAITRLAASVHTDIVSLAAPFIEAASRRTRETVDLSVLRNMHALTVSQYASEQELRVVSPVGTAFSLYCTAHGKAFLASHTDEEVRLLLDDTLHKRTSNTIDAVDDLLIDLKEVRRTGVAFDREEHAIGVCSVGVFLQCATTERYAISIAVPSLRFEAQLPLLRESLLKCKAEIEAQVGS